MRLKFAGETKEFPFLVVPKVYEMFFVRLSKIRFIFPFLSFFLSSCQEFSMYFYNGNLTYIAQSQKDKTKMF